MKKFIIKSLKLSLFAILVYLLLLFISSRFLPQSFKPNLIYPKSGYGMSEIRFAEVDTFKQVDVLFLGSSHAYRGFDNRKFDAKNISSFNLGSSSQTPIQTELLLRRYLNILNPALVIMEVSPLSFMSDGVESAPDLIANDQADFEMLRMAVNLNHIKVYNATLYAFMDRAIGQNSIQSKTDIKNYDQYVSGGFVEKSKPPLSKPYLSSKEKKISVNEKQLQAFERILRQLKERRIRVLLVQAPVTKNFYNSFQNNNYYDSLMSSYGNYINFNKILSLKDTLHFYDHHHLTQSGVEVFNDTLIKVIKEKYSF